MKKGLLLLVSLVLLAVSAAADTAKDGAETLENWGKLGEYGKFYDRSTESFIEGRVLEVVKIPYQSSRVGDECYCVSLRVQSGAGEVHTVYLGPCSYVKRNNFSFGEGDAVAVLGSFVEIHGRNLLLAKTIDKAGRTLKIRGVDGLHL